MKLLQNKPYQALWYTMLIILLVSLIRSNSSLDLQLHDTYFVVATIQIGIPLCIVLGILGLAYWVVRTKKLVDWMTAVHVGIIAFSFLAIITATVTNSVVIRPSFKQYQVLSQMLTFLIVLLALAQLVFVLNLIISLTNNEKSL